MEKYLIVGGGIAGLLAGRILAQRGIPFRLLEKADRVGGRALGGQHRIYSELSINLLAEYCSGVDWRRTEEEGKERKKGEFFPLSSVDKVYSQSEQFYLKSPFFEPRESFESIISALELPIHGSILTRKTVEKLEIKSRRLFCQDGSAYEYEKLLWCIDPITFIKMASDEGAKLEKVMKKIPPVLGGLNVYFETSLPLFEFRNSVVFSFRFKDSKLRAIGTARKQVFKDKSMDCSHWILFLDKEITEDREEVAKVLKTFKRELIKEFPLLEGSILREKIFFFPTLSGESPTQVPSLEVCKDIWVLGPNLLLPEGNPLLSNLDRVLENCRYFSDTLSSQAQS